MIKGQKEPTRHIERLRDAVKSAFFGVVLCAGLTGLAVLISGHFKFPVMMVCLFFGMACHVAYREIPQLKQGVGFTSRTLLRAGVVLIGARIMMSDFMSLGVNVMVLVVASTVFIILAGIILARILGLEKEQGFLFGGATAICGASAALALSAVLPPSKNLESHTSLAVIGVTTVGAIGMITLPLLVGVLDFSDEQAGLLIGGTIHDVAQVVGAGYTVSEPAGDMAVLVKLMRVFMLVPLLLFMTLLYGQKQQVSEAKPPIIPIFLLGFMLLMLLNSFNLIPSDVSVLLKTISKWLLMMAITAVGMKTSLGAIRSLGWRPVTLICGEAALLLIIYLYLIIVG